MKLQSGEKIVKVYHHHYIFFVIRSLKVWAASIPFFFMVGLLSISLPRMFTLTLYLIVVFLFVLVNLYDFLVYFLDSLVITNLRLVYSDWYSLFKHSEIDARLDDIQDIASKENGLLSNFALLNFGSFQIETDSKRMMLLFTEAPNPEEIKYFVTKMCEKYNETKLIPVK